MVLSAACFAGMSLLVKGLDGRVPVFVLAFFRSVLAIPLLTAELRRSDTPITSPSWPTLAMRGTWGVLAMLCYFRAIETIPLADAVMLNYASPAFAAFFAIVLLGERPTARVVVALGLAVIAVAALAGPTFSGAALETTIAAGAGVFSGAAYATVKHLTATDPPLRIVWWFNTVASLAMLPLAIAAWTVPSARDGLLLVGIALFGTAGQLLMTAGFRQGPISRSAIPTVLVLAFSTLGAWVLWGEVPSPWSWAGIAASVAAVALIAGETRTIGPARP
ncbi:MAG: DMT family transporter [Deltaproteobacteria bacterium]|nr:DMT family transporter [Deltaproteobacteria bacterium]